MPAEVVWSPVAVDGLDAIREWIADENDEPTAADKTITAILDRVDDVAAFPLATTPLDSQVSASSRTGASWRREVTSSSSAWRGTVCTSIVCSAERATSSASSSAWMMERPSTHDGAAWRHGVRSSSLHGAHEAPGPRQAGAHSHDTCQISDHIMHNRVRPDKDAAPDLSAAGYVASRHRLSCGPIRSAAACRFAFATRKGQRLKPLACSFAVLQVKDEIWLTAGSEWE